MSAEGGRGKRSVWTVNRRCDFKLRFLIESENGWHADDVDPIIFNSTLSHYLTTPTNLINSKISPNPSSLLLNSSQLFLPQIRVPPLINRQNHPLFFRTPFSRFILRRYSVLRPKPIPKLSHFCFVRDWRGLRFSEVGGWRGFN
uniref:Uncharacterized protein n=1 Tax=Kalanchoe fedtschenkoi TaxID=63787 RepID=A0A7N0U658_KALFE